ncbi:pyridoxal-phosphate dependent enzyme [Candidatus Bipolaricaulota bacterium]|nr:pyridoxal-phosphate dependent enzyme [Candidatus Bipolaricaulota bacterium]
MIDLTIHEGKLQNTVRRARERGIVIPTFEQMKNPSLIPATVKAGLKAHGLWDLHPLNLYRITWKNEPVLQGGGFGGVNYIEFPSALTGVDARIIALIGKWFPTGAHKVGATFGCLVPRLVTGQFDPTFHKAVWPSTGNFCRGGAYNSALLGCDSIAILPEEMSKERFAWLSKVAGEVIATPGCESNVWEIFQKCKELQATRDNVMIFDQFEEFGNHLWHYDVTGHAMQDVLNIELKGGRYAGVVLTSGSGGTMGCGDYLKEQYPGSKLIASEALQCPTMLENGFGGHRIEGIGDKHIPWIHNVRNTDFAVAIDDEDPMHLIRLFNEPEGKKHLQSLGLSPAYVEALEQLGISGVANVLASIKFAKYNELTSSDVVLTVLTDSMEMYGTRLQELNESLGPYTTNQAAIDHSRHMLGQKTDSMQELGYRDRKRIHNLKYFTWIEQMGRSVAELDRQWYDYDAYWGGIHSMVPAIDKLIVEFNEAVGLEAKR